MTRSTWMKLIALVLAVIMVTPLIAACNEVENGTEESSTEEKTESTTSGEDSVTESDTVTETASATETASETVNDTESATETDSETDSETESATETETEDEFETTVPPDQCTSHTFRTKNGIYRCIKCGYQPACKGDHPYFSNLSGHWKGACLICGKAVGKPQNHEFEEIIENDGDLYVYSFKCTVCNYVAYEQEVPYSANSFYSAGNILSKPVSGLSGSIGVDNKTGYASFSKSTGGSMELTVMKNGEIDEPFGAYLVMKVRLAQSKSSFIARIRSVYADESQTMTFKGLKSGWITLIVDVSKAATVKNVTVNGANQSVKVGYQPDAAGEYYLADFQISASAGAGEHVDISYIMFCDRLEDAQDFTKNENFVYVYSDVLNKGPETNEKPCTDDKGNLVTHEYILNPDGTHTLKKDCPYCGLMAVENEPHALGEAIVEVDGVTHVTYVCGICKHTVIDKAIPDSAKAFVTPTMMSSIVADKNKEDKWSSTQQYLMTGQKVVTADGTPYFSFKMSSTAAEYSWNREGKGSNSAFTYTSPVGGSKYFVVRMRVGSAGTDVNLYLSTVGEKKSYAKIPASSVGAGKWATYVIDLEAAIGSTYYAKNGEGVYDIDTFYFNFVGAIGDTVDIQYFAFVESDDLAGLKTIIDEPEYRYVTTKNGGNAVYDTETGTKKN